MRISTRLALAVLVPVLLALVVCLALVFSYRAVEVARENGDIVRRVRNSINELNYLLFSYVSYREERPKQQFLAECDSLTKLIAGIRLRDPEQQRLLEEIRLSSQAMKDPFLKLISMTDLSGPAGSDELSKELEQRLVGQLLTRSHRADSIASLLRSLVDDEIHSTHTRTTVLIFLVLALATGPLTVVLVRTRRRITTSLAKLRIGTEVVRSGNLDHTIIVERDDEIGELSHAFNRMTASLKEVTVSKAALEKEIVERKRAEDTLRQRTSELQQLTETLEQRVQGRTAELEKATEALRHLSSKLLSAQEEERKRIAGDLHDTIGSCLAGIKFKVEMTLEQIGKTPNVVTQSLNTIIPVVQEGIEECRRMQQDLRPSMLDDLGLLPTLSWFCRRFQTIYSGIRIEQEIAIQEDDIPQMLKIVVFRVTQEAMNNIAKHSKADLVRFSLRKLDDRMELVLQDNGRGFSLEKVNSQRATAKGLGLTSMRERAGLSGGSFDIESVEGKGTIIRASWPFCKKG